MKLDPSNPLIRGGFPYSDDISTSSLSKTIFKAEYSENEKISHLFSRVIYLFGIGGTAALARILYTRSVRPLKFNAIFLLAFLFTARKVGHVIAGYFVYKAAARSTFCPYLYFSKAFEKRRIEAASSLHEQGYQIKRMTFERLGTQYDAYLVSKEDTKDNGKWILHIGGVERIVENSMSRITQNHESSTLNHLFMNGPSVGRSQGLPTPFHMRNANEAALQYLERKQKATHIVVRAYSLGGVILSEVIAKHEFPEDTLYLMITEVSLESLAATAADITGCSLINPLFHFLGMELNGVKGAKILAEKKIRHIVIQHRSSDAPTDGVISDSRGLANALRKYTNTWDNLLLMESEEIKHDRRLPSDLKGKLDTEIRKFIEQTK